MSQPLLKRSQKRLYRIEDCNAETLAFYSILVNQLPPKNLYFHHNFFKYIFNPLYFKLGLVIIRVFKCFHLEFYYWGKKLTS